MGWKDVQSWDDVVAEGNRNITKKFESKRSGAHFRCTHYSEKGECFRYCASRAGKLKGDGIQFGRTVPTPKSAEYLSSVSVVEMQLFCLNGFNGYSKCVEFQNPPPDVE